MRPSGGLVRVSRDYRYVGGDLKRIGIIAGALFVVLIILGFVIV